MRVGPLPNGHVLLTLDAHQSKLAEEVAKEREKVLRFGRRGERLAKDSETHLEGTASEIAVAAFYDAPYEHAIGSDGGIDIRMGPWSVQVKSRPHDAHPSRHALSILEWDHLAASAFFQCITHPAHWVGGRWYYTVEIVGWADKRRILERPLKVVHVNKETGEETRARRISEDRLSLVSPDAIMSAMRRHTLHDEDAPPVPLYWGRESDPDQASGEAETERLGQLMPLIGVLGGVEVGGRRGTLINAMSQKGCRVVFLDETEAVRDTITRKNPAGIKVAHTFHALDVAPAELAKDEVW